MGQGACFVEGRTVSFEDAVRSAAALVTRARMPLFVLGACDVAGARAAIGLAQRVGGVIDHAESASAFRDLEVMRSFGKFIVTPSEVRQRADTVLLVGSGLTQMWPDMVEVLGLADIPRLALQPGRRQILRIGTAGHDEPLTNLADQTIAASDEALPGVIAALRARLAKRPAMLSATDKVALDSFAEKLRNAQFGAIIYSPASLDALAIEMLGGLVADLNRHMRFSTVSASAPGGAETCMQTAGWMTGFPVRTGFGRGYPEHDPWRFDAAGLLASGEADALVWISSDATNAPSWPSGIPVIALATDASTAGRAAVRIAIGQHGRDHDGVEFAREVQALTFRRASAPSDVPSAASVLEAIAASLPQEAGSC
jgi:formylmethanofuran dehydrogenase subunit B